MAMVSRELAADGVAVGLRLAMEVWVATHAAKGRPGGHPEGIGIGTEDAEGLLEGDFDLGTPDPPTSTPTVGKVRTGCATIRKKTNRRERAPVASILVYSSSQVRVTGDRASIEVVATWQFAAFDQCIFRLLLPKGAVAASGQAGRVVSCSGLYAIHFLYRTSRPACCGVPTCRAMRYRMRIDLPLGSVHGSFMNANGDGEKCP